MAASGDEIWVKQGTYYESITLISGVALYGGFDGAESIRSDRDWEVNITTIDASTAEQRRPGRSCGDHGQHHQCTNRRVYYYRGGCRRKFSRLLWRRYFL